MYHSYMKQEHQTHSVIYLIYLTADKYETFMRFIVNKSNYTAC